MKKVLAGLGVLALVTLGSTGATFPATADEVQPVAEIVVQSDAIVASPDVTLSQSEPVVTTSPAPEPIVVTVEPVVAPVEYVEPVVAPEPVAVVAEVTEPVAVDVPVITENSPEWDCATMGNLICGTTEAWLLFLESRPNMPDNMLATAFNRAYLGLFPLEYVKPMNSIEVTSVINPSLKYVYITETFPCAYLQPGDAKAGTMMHCYLVEASQTPGLTYLGSSATVNECATYFYPSALYDGVFHSFKDSTPSSNPACNVE